MEEENRTMKIKAVSIRSNGRREGVVAGREAVCRRVAERFSVRVALVGKRLGVGVGCK